MTLRSQQPDGVKQEPRPLMYNLIGLRDHATSQDEAKVQPCRISFITALRHIVDEWLWVQDHTPWGHPLPSLRP